MPIPEIKQLIKDGCTAQALEFLERHLNANPNDDEAWFLLGNAHRKQENWKDAMDAYTKATELNPDSPARNTYEQIVQILNFYDIQRYNV